MKKDRILIFPAGTEISFEIYNSLKYCKFFDLIGGTSVKDHSEMVYDKLIEGFPFIEDKNFIDFLNKIVEEYNIDYIYPAHDSVLMKLTEYRDKIKIAIVTTTYDTVKICRSKELTYEYFRGEKFIPKIYDFNQVKSYPVFIKPKVGQGSKGAKIILNSKELENSYTDDNVICEYLSGEEITVDCFTDNNRQIKVISPRTRERIRNGISVRSKKIKLTEEIVNIANIINKKLVFKGAWFFQLKYNNEKEYKLLEISPRIPGTMGLSRNTGINFPLLTLYCFKNIDCEIIPNDYKIVVDRALINRYNIDYKYKNVYVDLDDTLIVNDKVNLQLVMFLYQCVNKKINIYLITKHDKKVNNTLNNYHISINLFAKIIHINKDDEKYKYIDKDKSIFIDDSFAERKKVKEYCKIPVFDVDMIECLLDWRN